jgi:hypothetical protein
LAAGLSKGVRVTRITDVTVTQTDIAPGAVVDCEFGLGGRGGFDRTELTTGAGNEGAISLVVLHLKKGTTLDAVTTENSSTVARFFVESQFRLPRAILAT